ncbi:hypothetical protein PENSOL_c010G10741 [Penicillium solitum]|uniref:Uncharacterized protein n=1 Tax=Penicillium solitum TaxID=60172 RepID=A0A1V6R8X4_9EURO|nr:uncharacterized protein PENSOL_c010G10741 [Penicillium solitum]OQD97970.1 hypothetical protein PENSOL_c010G10741 [Penicillium solitum]
MADSKSWFPKSIKKGKTVKLTEPVSSRWKIVEKVNEHVEQFEDTELHPSLASAKFLCRDASDPSNKKDAYLRIVQQIPSVKGEFPDHVSREATQFTPELKAYQTLKERKSPNTPKLLAWQQETQDTSGPVPRGWITRIVFERVEGFPLGDEYGAGAFWKQSPDTQMIIRRVLIEEFSLAAKIGVLPPDEGPYSAIWNNKAQTM